MLKLEMLVWTHIFFSGILDQSGPLTNLNLTRALKKVKERDPYHPAQQGKQERMAWAES